jgi:arsenite transporter
MRPVAVYLAAVALGVFIGLVAPGADGRFRGPDLSSARRHSVRDVLAGAVHRVARSVRRPTVPGGGARTELVVVPPIVFALRWLAPDGHAVELVVLLTPCIDYVIVFTRLAGGSD